VVEDGETSKVIREEVYHKITVGVGAEVGTDRFPYGVFEGPLQTKAVIAWLCILIEMYVLPASVINDEILKARLWRTALIQISTCREDPASFGPKPSHGRGQLKKHRGFFESCGARSRRACRASSASRLQCRMRYEYFI